MLQLLQIAGRRARRRVSAAPPSPRRGRFREGGGARAVWTAQGARAGGDPVAATPRALRGFGASGGGRAA